MNGQTIRIRIDATRAITPPNLFGMDRKIAYDIRKYHSGWMCTGVTRGLAWEKFSGSPNDQGLNRHTEERANSATIAPNRSFLEK